MPLTVARPMPRRLFQREAPESGMPLTDAMPSVIGPGYGAVEIPMADTQYLLPKSLSGK